jgi:GT2 family glycosyltransferase
MLGGEKINLSIIIVSWKVRELLKKCLQSIELARDNLVVEIFVVDNNSQDGTVEMVKVEFPWVKLIVNDRNLGFTRANNLALKQARGEYMLLLNPDTELNTKTLSRGLEFMRQHPDCGVLGPKMFYSDGSLQPSVRRFPTIWPILLMLFKLPKIFPNLKSVEKYLAIDFDYTKEQEVDQVLGAFMLMPKTVLDKVGLLDERFFVWFEEVDLCRRIKDDGYKVIYSPDISIIHYGGKSFSQQALVKNQWLFFSSALKYFIKHGFGI